MAINKSLKVIVEAEVAKAQASLNNLSKSIKESDKNFDGVARSSDKAASGIKKASDQTGSFNLKTKDVLKGAVAFAGVGLSVQGLGQFMKSAISSTIDFEAEMRRVNTITRVSEEQFREMSRQVENLTKIVPFSAKQLSTGLFDVASAGISAQNQLAFLGVAAKAATAGVFDVKTAVEGLTAVIKGFGLAEAEAERVSDLFFKTNELGQTTVAEVAKAMQGLTTQAKLSGLTIEELFASFATFTGVTGNASEVATQMRGALNALAAPTTEASAKFKELGIEVGATAIEKKGFAGVAKEVFDAVGGDQEALRKLIPEIRATQLIAALATEQFDDWSTKLEELQDPIGATQEGFSEMMKSQQNQLKIAGQQWEFFKKRVGSVLVPLMITFVKFANSVVDAFVFIKDGVKIAVEAMSGIVVTAALGIVKVFANMVNGIIKTLNKIPKVDISLIDTSGLDDTITNALNGLDKIGGKAKNLGRSLFTDQSAEFAKFQNQQEEMEAMLGDLGDGMDAAGGSAAGAKTKVNELSKAVKDLTQENRSFAFDSVESFEAFSSVLRDTKSNQEDFVNASKKGFDSLKSKINSVGNDITSLQGKLKSARDSFSDFLESTAKSSSKDFASIVFEAEQAIPGLQEKLKQAQADMEKARGTDSFQDRQGEVERIQKQLQEKQAVLDTFNTEEFQSNEQLINELAFLREQSGKNELEQAFSVMQRNIELKTQEHNETVRLIEEQIAQKEQEKAAYIEAQAAMTQAFKENVELRQKQAEGEIESLDRLAASVNAVSDAYRNMSVARGGRSQGLEGRADGGPVSAGQPYIVGERGPELFTPNASGMITPNKDVGGVTININNPSVRGDNDIRDLVRQITNALSRRDELAQIGAYK